MKTFKDLKFETHTSFPNAKRAFMKFDNGYEVSVITGQWTYTDEDRPYELAVINNGVLCYTTPLTSDVLGYLTEEGITTAMKEVQSYKENEF